MCRMQDIRNSGDRREGGLRKKWTRDGATFFILSKKTHTAPWLPDGKI